MAIKSTHHIIRRTQVISETSDQPGFNNNTSRTVIGPYSWTDLRSGGELPKWRAFVKSGRNATNSYTANYLRFEPGTGLYNMTFENIVGVKKYHITTMIQGWPFNGFVGTADAGGISVPSNLDSDARLKFLSKVRNARTAFQSGTFFGELAETVAMLKSPVHALRHSLDAYHRTVSKRVRSIYDVKRLREAPRKAQKAISRAVQDTYLEWRFGALPLMGDAQDAWSLLDADPHRVRDAFSAQSSSRAGRSTETLSASRSPLLIEAQAVRVTEVSIRYKGALDTQSGSIPSFAEQLGVLPSNFAPTVWNLIPYSFLVDYFSSIGQVIDALSLGTQYLAWGCRTTRRSYTKQLIDRTSFPTMVGDGHVTSSDAQAPNMVWEAVALDRIPISAVSAGVEDIHIKVPGIGNPWKWLNVAALANLRRPS